jgi:hypothetical protein
MFQFSLSKNIVFEFHLYLNGSCHIKGQNGVMKFYSKKQSTNIEGDKYRLDRFVIMSHDGKRYSFLIRIPHVGTFKFSVFGVVC